MSSAFDPYRALRVLRGEMSPLHNSVPLQEAQGFPLARSLYSLKTQRPPKDARGQTQKNALSCGNSCCRLTWSPLGTKIH
jgi:hypothetical protein